MNIELFPGNNCAHSCHVYDNIIYQWSNTVKEYPVNTLPQFFNVFANIVPGCIIMEYVEQAISCNEANHKGYQLQWLISSSFSNVKSDVFPLNNNWKQDKYAFADAEFKTIEKYILPSSEIKINVRKILGSFLLKVRVCNYHCFSGIGRNSIISTQLASKLNQFSGNNILNAEMFRLKTMFG
jgi:hypothetical protein